MCEHSHFMSVALETRVETSGGPPAAAVPTAQPHTSLGHRCPLSPQRWLLSLLAVGGGVEIALRLSLLMSSLNPNAKIVGKMPDEPAGDPAIWTLSEGG